MESPKHLYSPPPDHGCALQCSTSHGIPFKWELNQQGRPNHSRIRTGSRSNGESTSKAIQIIIHLARDRGQTGTQPAMPSKACSIWHGTPFKRRLNQQGRPNHHPPRTGPRPNGDSTSNAIKSMLDLARDPVQTETQPARPSKSSSISHGTLSKRGPNQQGLPNHLRRRTGRSNRNSTSKADQIILDLTQDVDQTELD